MCCSTGDPVTEIHQRIEQHSFWRALNYPVFADTENNTAAAQSAKEWALMDTRPVALSLLRSIECPYNPDWHRTVSDCVIYRDTNTEFGPYYEIDITTIDDRDQARFVVGQRVRVSRYTLGPINPDCGDPPFIVGHFGHVEACDGDWIDVRISRGPNGGPVDDRVRLAREADDADGNVWMMLAEELEPVD